MTIRDVAELCVAALVEAKTARGATLTRADMAPIIEGVLERSAYRPRKGRKMPTPRKRCAIFDRLAELDGRSLAQLTRPEASRIGKAKAEILAVLPDRTEEQVVAEVNERWARYCRKFTDRRMQTVTALVAHWSEFASADGADRRATAAERGNIYREPDGDWRPDAAEALGVELVLLKDKLWLDLSADLRQKVLAWRAKHRSA